MRQTTVRLSPATRAQIEALAARGHGTQSDIIRTAVDRMYHQEVHTMEHNEVTGIAIYTTVDSLAAQPMHPIRPEYAEQAWELYRTIMVERLTRAYPGAEIEVSRQAHHPGVVMGVSNMYGPDRHDLEAEVNADVLDALMAWGEAVPAEWYAE